MRAFSRSLLAAALAAGFAVCLPAGGLAGAGGSLTITPSTIPLTTTFTVSGCGYPVPTSVSFEVAGPKKSGIDYFTAGEPIGPDGCFSEQWTAWWSVTGTYQITASYRDAKGSTHKAAVASITVVGDSGP
jgi:hypothetical protein